MGKAEVGKNLQFTVLMKNFVHRPVNLAIKLRSKGACRISQKGGSWSSITTPVLGLDFPMLGYDSRGMGSFRVTRQRLRKVEMGPETEF